MSSSDIIATCSVIVAVVALVATFWQAWLAHKHNRLSVRPLLIWHSSRTNNAHSSRIAFSVKNHGLGPAIVEERYFTKDGSRFIPTGPKTDEVGEFLAHVVGTKLQYRLHTYGLPGKESAIPSQAEIVIADVEFPSLAPSSFSVLEQLVGEVDFHVEYHSLYEKKFHLKASGTSAA